MTDTVGTHESARAALFPVRLLGFGLYLAWSALVSTFEQTYCVADLSSPLFRLTVGTVLTAAGLTFIAWRSGTAVGPRLALPRAVVVCGGCAVLSVLLDLACVASGFLALDLVAIVLKTVAGIGLFLAWNEELAAFGPRVAWVAYAGSMLLASTAYFLAGALGIVAVTVAVVILPVMSCLALVATSRLPEPERVPEEPVCWRFPWRPVVLVAAFALARGFVGHYGGNILAADELGRLVAGLVVLVGLLAAFDRFDIELVVKVSPALMVAALALCGVHGAGDASGAAKLLGCLGYFSFTLYLYLRLNTLCFRYGMSATWLFGLAQAANVLASLAGAALGNWARGLVETGAFATVDVTAGLLAVLLVLLCMMLTSGRSTDDAWGIRGIRAAGEGAAGTGVAAGGDYLRDHVRTCAEVARHFGLTHREEEVLALLAEGKTFQDVEAALTIAHGTMRVHVQHIYAKLGVHSCDEACAVVREWRP